MHYSKVKREKKSLCNLCRNISELTWDHVPPKGGIELSSVEMRTVLETLSGYPSDDHYKISQNGIKYRTLCKNCNDRLGQDFDPTLNKFANDVSLLAKSSLHLPPVLSVSTKPYRLIRAILGHLVSAKAEIDNVIFDREVREFIFEEDGALPENLHIFYWVYPYPMQVILRDIGMPSVRGDFSSNMFCHLLKYFPIAYLITSASRYEGLSELTKYRDTHPDDLVDISIELENIRDQHWPEAPDRDNILFGGQSINSSVVSLPRGK